MPDRDESGKDAETGQFLLGNRFWEARARSGPKLKYETAEELWKDCVEYFEWVEANPLWEDRVTSYQGINKHEPIRKMRAMTLGGLWYFLRIGSTTWDDWRDDRPDLAEVIREAEAVIREQKFTGAAADLLNANIIARDLQLVDKSATDHKIDITGEADEAKRKLAALIARDKGDGVAE